MAVFISNSSEHTELIGRTLGSILDKSDEKFFIAMYGDLGAGKTVFVRGLASVLSPTSRVKSPTFTIVNEYRGGKTPLFHFDLYRIKDSEELDGFGFDEYVDGGNCIAEWSENLGTELPDNNIKVKIEKLGESSRRITIETKEFIENELVSEIGSEVQA